MSHRGGKQGERAEDSVCPREQTSVAGSTCKPLIDRESSDETVDGHLSAWSGAMKTSGTETLH